MSNTTETLTTRVPAELADAIRKQARDGHRSVSSQIAWALKMWVSMGLTLDEHPHSALAPQDTRTTRSDGLD